MIRRQANRSHALRLLPHWPGTTLLAGLMIAGCAVSGADQPALAQGRPPQGAPPGGAPPGAPMRPQMPRPPKPLKVDEVLELAEKQHRSADLDRDGFLTKDEIRTQIAQMADTAITNRFRTIDTDRNGSIDRAEFTVWQKSMGSLALSDIAAASPNGSLVPETIPFDTDSDMKGEMLRMLVEPLSVTVVVNADLNYDGRVEVAELQQYQRQRFDALDRNSDGLLTFDELPRPERGPPPGMPLPPPSPKGAGESDGL